MAYNNKPMVQQRKFSAMIASRSYQDMIANTLRDPDRQKRFVASITSAVAATPALQTCNPSSILACALLGEGLNLSPSPQLGQYYLVPFKVKAKDRNGEQIKNDNGEDMYEDKAQFVLGYKGYVQLALRSGQYRKLNVMEVKRGEIEGFDPLNEEVIGYKPMDFAARQKSDTIGYIAFFEYLNGFRKTIYWTKDQMMAHADKYSPAFSAQAMQKIERGEIPDRDMWRYSSFWYKDFDGMARKTMLRQLISKWGIMSTEMQAAMLQDEQFAELNTENRDAPVEVTDVEIEEPTEIDVQTEVPAQQRAKQVSLADL